VENGPNKVQRSITRTTDPPALHCSSSPAYLPTAPAPIGAPCVPPALALVYRLICPPRATGTGPGTPLDFAPTRRRPDLAPACSRPDLVPMWAASSPSATEVGHLPTAEPPGGTGDARPPRAGDLAEPPPTIPCLAPPGDLYVIMSFVSC
jgi:hypothetical protein